MQNLILRHIQYTQLDPITWCATADVSSLQQPILHNHPYLPPCPLASYTPYAYPNNLDDFYWQYATNQISLTPREKAHNKRQQQRNGVRLLLQNLLTKIGITDTLDESKFPYQLVNSGYYVCFSHSGGHHTNADSLNSKVAVIISGNRAVGIDIETQDVEWHVAQRFYHPSEISILETLPVLEQTIVAKRLWQIKESFIKIHQYKLAQGLGMNYAPLISDITINFEQHNHSFIFTQNHEAEDEKFEYKVVFLSVQQTIVIF